MAIQKITVCDGDGVQLATLSLITEYLDEGKLPEIVAHPNGHWMAKLIESVDGPVYQIASGYYLSLREIN